MQAKGKVETMDSPFLGSTFQGTALDSRRILQFGLHTPRGLDSYRVKVSNLLVEKGKSHGRRRTEEEAHTQEPKSRRQ